MAVDARFWDKIAEQYAAQPVANPQAFDKKIEHTIACMRRDHVVLDVGCGTGSLALRLAPHGAELHGLDLSPEMIRMARSKAAEAGAGNVSFHVGAFDDGLTIFDDGSLDGVCAYSILHLVEDRTAALSTIYRLLKPGGFFVSSTTCLGNSWVPYRPILAAMRAIGRAPMVKIFSAATLVDDIKAAGFVDIDQPDVGADATIAFVVAHKPA